MKSYSMFEVKKASCKRERNFPMKVTAGKTSYAYERAIACKKVFHDRIDGRISDKEMEEKLIEAYANTPSRSEHQKEIEVADQLRTIDRYVQSEKRKLIPAVSEKVAVTPEMEINISPDYWYISEDPCTVQISVEDEKGKKKKTDVECAMTVELIKFSLGKKYDSDSKLQKDIGLYAMLNRARQRVPKGVLANVKASYYYLRRSDDSFGQKPKFAEDFFESAGGNVFTIGEIYRGEDPFNQDTDKFMQGVIQAWTEGTDAEDCSEDDCKKCDLYAICSYTEPPKKIKTKKTAKSLSSIMLTPQQEAAIAFRKGVARVNAGAGAGKTMTVALRVAYMISEGIDPKSILIITYTNAAIQELRERIKAYLLDFGFDEETVDKMEIPIFTFNAFGYTIIKREYKHFGFSKEPQVVSGPDRKKIIAYFLNKEYVAGLDYRHFSMKSPNVSGALATAEKVFSLVKKNQYGRSDGGKVMAEIRGGAATREAVDQLLEIYDEFDQRLRDEGLLEFADQEVMLMQLIADDPYYLDALRLDHIIVDEFQDSNETQIQFLQKLTECANFQSLMVVGDDNQAIYAFNGTTPEYIIHFNDYFKNYEVVDFNLDENHRSKKPIIDFANAVAEKNTERVIKSLVATREGGQPVTVKGFLDQKTEYQWVVDDIKRHIDDGVKPENITFLARTNGDLLKMADLLTATDIPSLLTKELYMQNPRVLAVIALFKFMDEPEDTKDALTFINARRGGGLDELSEEDLENAVADLHEELNQLQEMEPGEEQQNRLKEILSSIDHNDDEIYQAWMESIISRPFFNLIDYIRDYEEFGQEESARRGCKYPGVALMTAHGSKGLENEIVYCSLDKFDSPETHGYGHAAFEKVEEARRLVFVASTRARDELYIVGTYDAYGNKQNGYTYNQFLKEAYDIVGQEFKASNIEAERAYAAELKKAKAAEAKKAKAQAEKAAKEAEKAKKSEDIACEDIAS